VSYFDYASPMRVVDLPSGHSLTLAGKQPACPGGWRWSEFTPDGKFVAASTFCGAVLVWDARSGRRITQFNTGVAVSLMDFSSDDLHLAVGTQDGNTTIWNVRTARPAHVLPGSLPVGVVKYTPDGKLLVTTSFDSVGRIWDTASGRLLRVLPHSGYALVSPDGRFVATGDLFGLVRVWSLCPACGDAHALLATAKTRVTRQLTPLERTTFGG
jgi:WD40 repeat protein